MTESKNIASPEAAPSPPPTLKPAPAKVEQSTLVTARVWDVYSPPPINTFRSAVTPRSISKYSRRRKVSIDVYRVRVTQPAVVNPPSALDLFRNHSKAKLTSQALLKAENATSYEECVFRVFDPGTKAQEKASKEVGRLARLRRKKGIKNGNTPTGTTIAGPSDDVSLLEGEDGHHDDHDHDHDDDVSVVSSTGSTGVPDEFLDTGAVMIPQLAGWKPKFRIPISIVTIKESHKTSVTILFQSGKLKQTRELVFDSREDAEDFVRMVDHQKSLESERTEAKLKASVGDLKVKPEEEITFLIEIVSAWNIPAGDLTSSDPYVICSFQGKHVHRTKYISKTLEPIWTLKTGSLFLLTVEARILFLSEGLVCDLMEYDSLGTDDKLATVTVPPKDIYEASGRRIELKLEPPTPKIKQVPGYLAIRCRRATDYDINFLHDYHATEKTDSHSIPILPTVKGKGAIRSIVTKTVKTEREGIDAGKKKYRIRPGPDPKHKDSTEWMTQARIEEECWKDSQHWIDAGSGSLGRLFLEIIGCDGLPNLDVGGFLGNKTDAFAAIVYEDVFVMTDVIDDCLSPRWMPWTKRAFTFHIMHSSSQIFIGVFDYDGGLDDHDLIGRVSVDITNLRPNTVYTLKYNLYASARMSERKDFGTITIRLRLDIDDERKLLLSNLEPPQDVYVNVKSKRDFRVVRYTCFGKYDMDKYSIKVINSYVEELLAYQHVLYYLQDALIVLLLWRGHLSVKIKAKTYLIPLHSINAFITAILLVERPQLFPSFSCAFIAWCLLAVMAWRRELPDRWSCCKSYAELTESLVLGGVTSSPDTIAKFENYEEAKKMMQAWQNRIAEDEKRAAQAQEEAIRIQEEQQRELEEIGEADTDISTKQGGVSVDPFKPFLYPVQQYLGIICRCIRFVRYVTFWEECYFAYWITTACLLLAFAFLFVPWFWIIKWTSRIVVWTVFGPWMKLVDVYHFSKIKPVSQEESLRLLQIARERRRQEAEKRVAEARIRKENAAKLKEMKKYLFGKYITKIPVLKQDRFRDVPLPESHAEPYDPEPLPLAELAMKEAGYHRTRLPGQQLVGDMIPQIHTQNFTDAPIGKATAHPRLLDQNGPGGAVGKGAESTTAAYAKIGSVVLAAGVVTWFGVPLLASVTEKIIEWF